MIRRLSSPTLKPQEWLLVLFCAVSYPVSQQLPPAWGWEDGPIENAQVLLLLAGCLWACGAALRPQPAPLALLARCVAPLWLVLTARELSWGAVLMTPLGHGHEGPIFSSALLWYKPAVRPLLALLFAWMAYAAWRHRLDRLLVELVKDGRFPWLPAIVATLCMLGSSCAEGHLGCALPFNHPQAAVFEELSELIAYLALLIGQAGVLAASAGKGHRLGGIESAREP